MSERPPPPTEDRKPALGAACLAYREKRREGASHRKAHLAAVAVVLAVWPLPWKKQAPMLRTQVADPVGSGFVSNYARLGGNITGFTDFDTSIAGKWMEILKEAAPFANRVTAVQCVGSAFKLKLLLDVTKVKAVS
jgi:ABC-type uncharacterized transport system substrate-binding protein